MATEVATWAAAGVYAIINSATGERYIGSANMLGQRWGDHLQDLRKGKVPAKLQAAWDEFGEAAFTFEVLEAVADCSALAKREQAWINHLQPTYNGVLRAVRTDHKRLASSQPPTEYVRERPLPHLKAWRMHKLMAQIELAERSGLAKSTLARAERGDEVVSFANIRTLAEALGVSADDLLNRAPEAGK
jgi:DNA-binding Xre family transcriptional regulator